MLQATNQASRITDTEQLSQHPDNIYILNIGKKSGISILFQEKDRNFF